MQSFWGSILTLPTHLTWPIVRDYLQIALGALRTALIITNNPDPVVQEILEMKLFGNWCVYCFEQTEHTASQAVFSSGGWANG